jgi:hypothetical protein
MFDTNLSFCYHESLWSEDRLSVHARSLDLRLKLHNFAASQVSGKLLPLQPHFAR